MIDIDMGKSRMASKIKNKGTKCIISYHNYMSTPPLNELKQVCRKQIELGADICKIVTMAEKAEDNLVLLELVKEFKKNKIVGFCMGPLGIVSRILSPLAGGAFTYASAKSGKESAPGQIPAEKLRKIYELVK